MKILGWAGTALVTIAYYPQIHHLFIARCAWGISLLTWLIWFVASVLLLLYAVIRQDSLFIIVQSINLIAIAATIVLTRRSNRICPYHLKLTEARARQ